jgi:acyl-CoA synthetase (NDP forming)
VTEWALRVQAAPLQGAGGSFGALTPLLAARSVAVVGASDREGNLGGLAVGFLRKFGFAGPVWPVNAGRPTVGGLSCYPDLRALPGTPDLAILAVPAEAVTGVVRDCIATGVPAAVAWAGGFAEAGDDEGRARQRELTAVCRDADIQFCGPNCIGIINTSIGLTASFSTMLNEHARLTPGVVSMVSQSGGIGVMAHARAQRLGLGFRITISCGNEAALGIAQFIQALVQDDGTRVIAVYTEGLSDPAGFVDALSAARERRKPVVILKGGATEASGRAALAHTGRLAGSDRTYDAIFRELAAIRVYSSEELVDVCLQLASVSPSKLPAGDRVLVTSFGGGSGVIATDQCGREGLSVPALDDATQARLDTLVTPLSSVLNPIDFTPGMMTNATHRARLPVALDVLADAPGLDTWLFMAAGFNKQAPELVTLLDTVRARSQKPIHLTWQSMPAGIAERMAERGYYVFDEQARAVRAAGHLVRYAANLRHRIRRSAAPAAPFAWHEFVRGEEGQVVSEHTVAAILEKAGLPVARGRLARTPDEAVQAAKSVGFPVAIKGISPAITHRAKVGLVALDVTTPPAVAKTAERFRARAAQLGATLEGVWVQHMFTGAVELLVTAFRDAEFGVMVGVGLGGGATEAIDDVAFSRAPLDAAGALDLLGTLRTLRRLPDLVSAQQRTLVADFIARFAALAASAPWRSFTLEVNPLKLAANDLAAVDGLLLIESN